MPPGDGLRAVLLSLARQARRDVERIADGPEKRIHRLRTGMKKYRSLLRLVRNGSGGRLRRALLERVRGLKDGLAGSRDETAIFETVRRVLGPESTERLGLHCPQVAAETCAPEAMRLAAVELTALTESLEMDGLDAETLKHRWERTAHRMRVAAKAAARTADAQDFHSWRMRAKDLWYQSAALGRLDTTIAAARRPAAKLSALLGAEHDLTLVLDAVRGLRPAERKVLRAERERLRAAVRKHGF